MCPNSGGPYGGEIVLKQIETRALKRGFCGAENQPGGPHAMWDEERSLFAIPVSSKMCFKGYSKHAGTLVTMSAPIADYALVGDLRTAALLARDGSVDWLCLPRFDSAACFAALLGEPSHGRWLLAPEGEVRRVRRAYRPGTLVLDTEFETASGCVRVSDFMPLGEGRSAVMRIVTGLAGTVDMRLELVVRFDYGSVVPWVTRDDGGILAIAGPDALRFRSAVPVRGEGMTTVGKFSVACGETLPFSLTYYPSHETPPVPLDASAACEATVRWWQEWSSRSCYAGDWPEAVTRSLLTLKALTYAPTGGTVAAVTTSLPEQPGGARNWDYRFCWLRDATFTLYALQLGGYVDEARGWREWLLRAAAGRPEDLQILYGIAGERRLAETTLPWLPGYRGAKPVRVGNAASEQFQLDVYGEVMDAPHFCRRSDLQPGGHAWELQKLLLDFLEGAWQRPDNGIWEIRSERRHFTYSKVMAWVAFDRAVKAVERFQLDGPAARWRKLRQSVHDEVCTRGYSRAKQSFVQHYDSEQLDASLLLMPLVGFLPPTEPRMVSTVRAIQRDLTVDGLVRRYDSHAVEDGLPGGEGVFLPCSFWLVDNLALAGRRDEACNLFERLLALRNDVGLLAEEYNPATKQLLGNFPQALTHVALCNSAYNLSRGTRPGEHRADGEPSRR
jgi:GH15 family glucan-1,4-alpha-glucosidase